MSGAVDGQQILRTKLFAPRLQDVVERKGLLKELEGDRSAKLSTIVAGPGYGKSTLAAGFLRSSGCPFVWYQLEETDSDLSVFLSYLIEGLRETYHGFGHKTLEHVETAGKATGQSRPVLATFVTEMDSLVDREIFISLDDFHTVGASPVIADSVQFLLDHSLPSLHFLILSRSSPGLDLSTLRAHRELLELGEKDLSFSREETARLASDVFGLSLTDEDIASLWRYTEGWVSGLILFNLALKGIADRDVSAAISELGALPSTVADYLSRAVYSRQPQEVRHFLTRTAILSRLNPDFCCELLGADGSHECLSSLAESRMFTLPLDERGQWYRYHPCLSAFLLRTLEDESSPGEVKELHLKAAGLWEKRGEHEQALAHYVEAASFEQAAEVLERISGDLMRSNRISFLDRELTRLPEDILCARPVLMFKRGISAFLLGDWEHVTGMLSAAAEGFAAAGKQDEQAISQLVAGEAFIYLGKPGEAEEMVRKAREAMTPDSPFWYEVLSVESLICRDPEKAEMADRLVEEALRLEGESHGSRLKVGPLTWYGVALFKRGRLNRALEIFQRAYGLTEIEGLTQAHPLLSALLTHVYTLLDRLDEAVEQADGAIALGEKHGLDSMVFLNRAARAVVMAYLGDHDRALQDASMAASMSSERGSIGEATWAEWFLAQVSGITGACSDALARLDAFERVATEYLDFDYVAKVLITGFSVQDLGVEAAIRQARSLLRSVRKSDNRLALSMAYSLLVWLDCTAGKYDEAAKTLETYISEFGQDIMLRLCTVDAEWMLPVFTELFARGRHFELMDRVFSIGGSKSIPYLKRLARSRNGLVAARARQVSDKISRQSVEPLIVRMLGRFEVSRAGRTLSTKDWKSRKALTIFQYLAANGDSGFVRRDVLMELLWPDIPFESAHKSLNTALTALRKTIEPESGRGESAYLVADGDSLRLDTGPGGWIDSELFGASIAAASAAREAGDFELYFRMLHNAEDLYQGDFLVEAPHDDWCLPEREALASAYIDLQVDIATEHLRRGEGAEALAHLEEVLGRDPGREELYRMKMVVCSKGGDRAGVEEAFRRCRKYLRDNYEVSPSPETAELYERLRGQ